MGLMAQRPRVPLRNPYLISLSKQKRLCPLCGKPTRLNGLELSDDGAVEVCDNPDCTYFMAVEAPEWARVGGEDAISDGARGHEGVRWPRDGLFSKPVESPYFRSLSKQVRLCPRCGEKTRLAGTLNPDAAYEVCGDCGFFTTLVAPEWACVGEQVEPARSFTVIEDGLGRSGADEA